MTNALRYDLATIELSAPDKDGFIRPRVAIARAGVFPYLYSDGSLRLEAKLPEDLCSPETIDSAKGVPICEDHPPISDSKGLITTRNFSKYARGSFGDSIEVKDNVLWGNETIWDEGLQEKLKNGEKVEVSIGFETDIDPTPGEFEGQRYDVRQTNIRINHVAHVDKGRAGEKIRAYLDQGFPKDLDFAVRVDNAQGHSMSNKPNQGKGKDDKSKIASFIQDAKDMFAKLGVKYDESGSSEDPPNDPGKKQDDPAGGDPPSSDDPAKELEHWKARAELLAQLLEESKKVIAQLQDPATQDALARRRHSLVETVKALDKDAKTDGLSEKELKTLVIKSAFPPKEGQPALDSLSPTQLDARYDVALELAREKAAIRDGEDNGTTSSSTPDQRKDADELKKIRIDRMNLHLQGDKTGGQK